MNIKLYIDTDDGFVRLDRDVMLYLAVSGSFKDMAVVKLIDLIDLTKLAQCLPIGTTGVVLS